VQQLGEAAAVALNYFSCSSSSISSKRQDEGDEGEIIIINQRYCYNNDCLCRSSSSLYNNNNNNSCINAADGCSCCRGAVYHKIATKKENESDNKRVCIMCT